MKNGSKFIVFKSDPSIENASQLTVIRFDKYGIAEIIHKIDCFFENLEEKLKDICKNLCPPMTEQSKDEIDHLAVLQTKEADQKKIRSLLDENIRQT